MSTPANQGTNRTLFGDGGALTSDDLEAIGLNSTKRAWDSPGYANLLAFDLLGNTYSHLFDSYVDPTGIKFGVFTIGGGLAATKASTPLQSLLGSGYIGIWDESRVTAPRADDATPRMSWAWVKGGDFFCNHDAASSGSTRYDLVHCAPARSNLTASRDFQDAVTGALTSTTQAIAEQLSVDIQVTKGTQSTGTPTLPSLPSGRHALYAVRVNDTAITEMHDFVLPVGTLVTAESVPALLPGLGSTFNWAPSGYFSIISTGAAGDCYVLPPAGILGNPNARILGVGIFHKLLSGDTVELVEVSIASNVAIGSPNLFNVGGQMTIDGGTHEELIDLRGLPAAGANWKPFYGQGANHRANWAPLHHTVALKFNAATVNSNVYGVTWYAIQG